jgi:glycosyltransferase involved in cell wall biosynthesis
MRILMVNDLSPAEGAGAEVYVSRLAEELRARGDEVELFWPDHPHRGASKVFDLWDPRTRRALQARAAAFSPHVVHHHNVLREASVSVLGVPRSVPSVLTLHDHRMLGSPDYPARTALDRLKVVKTVLDRWWAKRRLAAVMAVSDELVVAARAAGFPDVRRVAVFAPLPTSEVEPAASCHDIVFVGRVTEDKGVDLLVDAFAAIAEDRPAARLIVVGDGAALPAIRGRAAALGARVELRGWADAAGVAQALARARVVVLPSRPAFRREGMPIVAIEAALSGRPLVVAHEPGLLEFVERARCGLAFAAGDAKALAKALDEVLSDDELVERLGANGREFAWAHHTPDAAVRGVRTVYEAVV